MWAQAAHRVQRDAADLKACVIIVQCDSTDLEKYVSPQFTALKPMKESRKAALDSRLLSDLNVSEVAMPFVMSHKLCQNYIYASLFQCHYFFSSQTFADVKKKKDQQKRFTLHSNLPGRPTVDAINLKRSAIPLQKTGTWSVSL